MGTTSTPEGGEQPRGPSSPTPSEVLEFLRSVFGEQIGETGYDISAAKCTLEVEKSEARKQGRSLLYGELLPDGVSKALLPSLLGDGFLNGGGTVLELGMGSGKVAMQIFAQCPAASRVVGVELVPSRFALAEAALSSFVAARPQAFRSLGHKPGEIILLEDMASCRKVELRCADFFAYGLHLCESSSIILFAVSIPCRLFPQLCEQLAKAKEGCRLFTYHPLDAIWWCSEPCPFRQVEANVPETDTFATSWSPQGYRFYVYVCDRSREPEIHQGIRNETFSEWQAVWDQANGAYYFHNQETEVSQWEVPCKAGCWSAEWSQEHEAYFFHHIPTGHTQWEVPKCLSDLGWSAG